jgi:hypothetical protein
MEDGPYRRAWDKVKRPPSLPEHLQLVSVSPRLALFSSGFWARDTPPRAALVDRASGKLLADVPFRVDAFAETDGRPTTLLVFERESDRLRFYDLAGKERFPPPGRAVHHGNTAATLSAGDRLIIAPFHRIATGASLFAVDSRGQIAWTAEVQQLNVPHSKYFNDVALERVGDTVVMRGYEAAGCYLQLFDVKTGRRLYARIDKSW